MEDIGLDSLEEFNHKPDTKPVTWFIFGWWKLQTISWFVVLLFAFSFGFS